MHVGSLKEREYCRLRGNTFPHNCCAAGCDRNKSSHGKVPAPSNAKQGEKPNACFTREDTGEDALAWCPPVGNANGGVDVSRRNYGSRGVGGKGRGEASSHFLLVLRTVPEGLQGIHTNPLSWVSDTQDYSPSLSLSSLRNCTEQAPHAPHRQPPASVAAQSLGPVFEELLTSLARHRTDSSYTWSDVAGRAIPKNHQGLSTVAAL